MTRSELQSWLASLVLGLVVGLGVAGCGRGPSGAADPMVVADAAEEQAAAERSRDPAWKPACEEVAVIQVGEKGKGGALHNFCLNTDGNILTCYGGSWWRYETEPGQSEPRQVEVKQDPAIRVFSPDGKQVKAWPLATKPQAICVAKDGAVYVGGDGRVSKLDQEGKVLAAVDSPVMGRQVQMDKAFEEQLRKESNLKDEQIAEYKRSLEQRKKEITGIAVTDQDVFVACPSVTDFSFTVYRLDRDLQNPKLVVEGLRGCCSQMDIQARDGKLWIPHNARHRVQSHDRDGKELVSFGKRDRKAADGFGGCCEPKNLRFADNGDVFTAESGPPVAIKRFTPEGKFVGVMGVPNFSSGCVRVTIEVSPDGKRFYILDTGDDAIHVLAAKG